MTYCILNHYAAICGETEGKIFAKMLPIKTLPFIDVIDQLPLIGLDMF